ncbi:MAPEG family protein [Pseudomonas sp. C 49-2]|uniref:MAPEG family protein n=1 Tax=Pseudomonas TaxID=286 RepID=UPI000F833081|nr:MAPEG family protein [Pseudomonas sp. C 49-2]RTX94164.1 MAPEG family protein [Pseudomonas sp. C 49-2]
MSDLLQVYALCVLVLCLKMFAISCYQGVFRIRRQAFTNLEDAAFFKRAAHSAELPQVVRATKAWANDLESIPLFFVLGGLCIALGASGAVTAGLCVCFTLARVAHTVMYLVGCQPWRTLAYGLGAICLLGQGATVVARLMVIST